MCWYKLKKPAKIGSFRRKKANAGLVFFKPAGSGKGYNTEWHSDAEGARFARGAAVQARLL